jgi:hypothetical protein
VSRKRNSKKAAKKNSRSSVGSGTANSPIPGEAVAFGLFTEVNNYVVSKSGYYLRGPDGSPSIILEGQRIQICDSPNNFPLQRLFQKAARVTTKSSHARKAIERLAVLAWESAGKKRCARFAELSEDGQRLYVPGQDHKLAQVSASGITLCENGNNLDEIFVEHPYEEPVEWKPQGAGEIRSALEQFERLCVETQACVSPEMRWFVAMGEGLFPYLRKRCRARFLILHVGPSQSGKTTGGRRFTLLHGLGDVKGDYTAAAYNNLGDIGLLVLDNKEQANLRQSMIDFMLFLATAAERGRSTSDGEMRARQVDRPVGVLTSIEGVPRRELKNRCVNVAYAVREKHVDPDPVEKEILANRHLINSALLCVLQEFLKQQDAPMSLPPTPMPGFEAHFHTLCRLLRAFETVAGKPARWADTIMEVWSQKAASASIQESDPGELEILVAAFINRVETSIAFNGQIEYVIESNAMEWRGRSGTMHKMDVSTLLLGLHEENRNLKSPLPRDAAALGRRLRDHKWRGMEFLDEKAAPELNLRTATHRYIAFFIPRDDRLTPDDRDPLPPVIPVNC